MSSVLDNRHLDYLGNDNITTRRVSGPRPRFGKMASSPRPSSDLHQSGSLLIDSILSQDETKDILTMMIEADEHTDQNRLPSFYTSTQMGGRLPPLRPSSPLLSPLGPPDHDREGQGELANADRDDTYLKTRYREVNSKLSETNMNFINSKNKVGNILGFESDGEIDDDLVALVSTPKPGTPDPGTGIDRHVMNTRREADPLTLPGENKAVSMGSNLASNIDTDKNNGQGVVTARRADRMEELTEGQEKVDAESDGDSVTTAGDEENEDPLLSELRGNAGVEEKIRIVDGMISRLDNKSTKLSETVKDLETSLEFSQNEILTLKKENAQLKQKLGMIEMEDKRTQFQVNCLADKVDRIETLTKKKSLLFEGIPEQTEEMKTYKRPFADCSTSYR